MATISIKVFTNGQRPVAIIMGPYDDQALVEDVKDVAIFCRKQAVKNLKKQRNHWIVSTPKMLLDYATTMINNFYRPLLNLYTNSLRPKEQQLPIKRSDFINFYQRYQDAQKNFQLNPDVQERLENNPTYRTLRFYSIDNTQEGLDDVTYQSLTILAKGYPKNLLKETDCKIMLNEGRFCYAIVQLNDQNKLTQFFQNIYDIELKRCQNYTIGELIGQDIEQFDYYLENHANRDWVVLNLIDEHNYHNHVIDTNNLTDLKTLIKTPNPHDQVQAKRDLDYPTREDLKNDNA